VIRLEAQPPLAGDELEVLRVALERAGVLVEPIPTPLCSAWSRSARYEAVEDEDPEVSSYALWPRRTCGATRA
jgi:hypothetical protein